MIRPNSIYTSILLLLAANLPNHIHARDDLILSLDEVIGKPPERPVGFNLKQRDTFYSITQWSEDDKMKELIDTQERGIVLTDEQQEILRERRMGVNAAGTSGVIRRIYPPVLSWVESNVKATSGKRYAFISCIPRADGPFATALILDPEIAQQKEAGTVQLNQIVRRMPIEAEAPWPEPFRGRYVTNNPIGNQLISHAVSIIIPINETLEKAEEIPMEDWKSILDHYTRDKDMDANSLFLVATKEYASLALRLAASYPFIGLMLEEPEQGIFGQALPADTSDAVTMTAIQDQYLKELEALSCKILYFRHRNNSRIPMNDMLILKPLIERKHPLFLGLTEFPFRRISQEDVEKAVPEPRFVYDTEATQKITQRMLYFIQQEGERPLMLLPEESTEPRSSNRASELLNQFDYMTKRLEDLTSEYVDNANTEVQDTIETDAGNGL